MNRIILKNSPVPLHFQISEYLLNMLNRGDINPEKKFPTEEELQITFGVSRTTIRKAIDHLLEKGLLSRKQGKGTFWTDKACHIRQEKPSGINRQIFNVTQKTTVKVLSRSNRIVDDQDVCQFLRIPRGSHVTVFERIRYIEGSPMSYTINFLPPEFGERIKKEHLVEKTMLETLESVLNIELGTIEHQVEITRADDGISNKLGINILDPVLTINTLVFDLSNNPIEIVWTYFVEDKYKFRVIFEK